METESRSQIIRSKPIGQKLNTFRSYFNSVCEDTDIPTSSEALDRIGDEETRYLFIVLFSALQNLPVSRHLPSNRRGGKNLRDDLSKIVVAVNAEYLDFKRTAPLLKAILDHESDDIIWNRVYNAITEFTLPYRLSSFSQTPWLRNRSSFANSTDHHKYADDVSNRQSISMSALSPFVRLPPEIRCLIYRILLRSERHVRMVPPPQDEDHIPCPNNLHPSILGTCRLIYQEAHYVLYGENAFHAHRINKANHNAALIRRAKYIIGSYKREDGEEQARQLVDFLVFQKELRFIELCFGFNLLEDPGIFDLARQAIRGHRNLMDIKAVFEKCKEGDNPLYREENGWQVWPKGAREQDVLSWFAETTGKFIDLAREYQPDSRPQRRPLAQPHQPLQGSTAGLLGFLWLSEEQLGFDPSIITARAKGIRYIEIERNNQKERLIIDKVILRAPCVAGRATTCWKAYREGDESRKPLIIKDSWQYPEREEEGDLLREATDKGVVNVARYYYHETVLVGGQDDTIRANVRQSLDITKAINYLMPPPSGAGRHILRKGRSSSAAGQKRPLSCTDAPLRICSSSSVKGERATADRVHRRVIIQDYGKPIYMANSRVSLLAALEGCITGYESLHKQAGMLQRDISPNNLIVNEEEDNPSWSAFLIDLDLAIKENREKPPGAQGKTGTRAFMAIGVLLDDELHSFMHDLESFFWVLFWICIHYEGPNTGRVVPQFERWNYIDTKELAELKKGEVDDERDFLRAAEENFTSYFQPLIPWVNRLRRKVFPNGGRWRDQNAKLYADMKEILRAAQDELKGLE
ncbi:hypothetical protein GQ44DRAFT_758368 [Phaeosphaeriaceae sp. PMI808]|nr:hypothetical protein GQ44DRAFT_758368 [Phaeosphaeriaceae sp. PMI808]